MKKLTVVGAIVGALLFTLSMGTTAIAAEDYYEFSEYSGPGAEYDVACYGNTIYYGAGTAVYAVDVSVPDITKKDEPRYLPNGTPNPNYQPRTFSNVRNIILTPPAGVSLNTGSVGEMYVDDKYIYTTGGSNGNQVYAFDKTTGQYVAQVVNNKNTKAPSASHLSYGGGKWWMSNENRQVWSSIGGDWQYEFTWNDMAGWHGDGMEYVNGHIFVSDMTSNYIAMWDYVNGQWQETKRFSYTEPGGENKYVEGMGFGALGHFWAGNGMEIYELGGGTIGNYVTAPIPGSATLLLLGMMGLAGFRKKIFNT